MRLSTLSLAVLGSALVGQAIDITAAPKVPAKASEIVDQAFLGFATEAASFPNFTNAFSQNLFNVFHNATGAPVIFRVGGTSMDHSIFDLNQEEDFFFPNGRNEGLRSSITFGKHWFRGFQSLQNIKFMLDVPLARRNLTNLVKFTRHCLQAMGDVEKLHALEIGNEVDVYVRQDARNDTWDADAYAKDVKKYMDLLTSNVTEFPKSGRIFQLYDKGTEIDFPTPKKWSIENVMQSLVNVVDMTRVKQIAEHYYQAKAKKGATLQTTLLNHGNTTSSMHDQFRPELDYLREHHKHLGFVLSEVGNTLGSSNDTTTDQELASSLGAAVWTVDWMLWAMTMNISSVNMQMGRTFPFAAWQPNAVDGDPPRLHAPFHGHVFVADFISRGGDLQVAHIPSSSPDVSAYAGYHGGSLAKVAITNLKFWRRGSRSAATRPSTAVTVDLGLGPAVRQATVRKLWGRDSVALEGVSWAGRTWPYSNAGLPVTIRNDTETVAVRDGKVVVNIEATTAVLLSW